MAEGSNQTVASCPVVTADHLICQGSQCSLEKLRHMVASSKILAVLAASLHATVSYVTF